MDLVLDIDPAYLKDVYGYSGEVMEMQIVLAKMKQNDIYRAVKKYSDSLSFVGGFFGVISNLFFVVVLLSIKGSLRSSLKLLLSLAVSDFVQSALNIMMRYVEFDTFWAHQSTLGDLTASPVQYVAKRFLSDLYFLSDLTGHVMLVVMATDIFLAVRNPLSYRSLMSKHRGNIVIVCIWLVCYIIVTTSTLVVEIVFRTTELGERDLGIIVNGYVYLYSFARELNAIFFLAILCIYIAIVIQVNRHTLIYLSVAKQLKMAFTLGVIVLSYMFCSCPFGTTSLFIQSPFSPSFLYLYIFTRIQFVANSYRSFFNSIIYAARIPELQRQIRRCCKRGEVTRASTLSTITTIRTASKRRNNSQRIQ